MPFKISPSTIGLLEECPQCFWLQIVKGQSRPSGPFPSLPSGVDKLLKGHFDSFRAKGELPPELADLVDEVSGIVPQVAFLGVFQYFADFLGNAFFHDGV